MTIRNVPITIGDEDLYLRFDQHDVIAAESAYGIGFVFFFDDRMCSLNLIRILFLHGLKTNRTGTLVPRCRTRSEAGDLVRAFVEEHYIDEVMGLLLGAFVAGGWMRDPADITAEDIPDDIDERPTKNLAQGWVDATEPVAFGICGLTPQEFEKMTPAEFRTFLEARVPKRAQGAVPDTKPTIESTLNTFKAWVGVK